MSCRKKPLLKLTIASAIDHLGRNERHLMGTDRDPVSTCTAFRPTLNLSPTYPFNSPSTHNLYPLPILFTTLSKSFQNLTRFSFSPSVGPYTTTARNVTLGNLNLTHRILELTYPKSITALCHYLSLKKKSHLSYLCQSLEHHETSRLPFNLS